MSWQGTQLLSNVFFLLYEQYAQLYHEVLGQTTTKYLNNRYIIQTFGNHINIAYK